jgi:hypothetical protein
MQNGTMKMLSEEEANQDIDEFLKQLWRLLKLMIIKHL